jgi:pumilio RNA-binding family
MMHATSWGEQHHCQGVPAVGLQQINVLACMDNSEQGNAVIQVLEEGSLVEKHNMLVQLYPIVQQLAVSKGGCRIVQKAFEVAGGQDRDMLITALEDYIIDMVESPHGNHVLSKAIEVLPAAKISFVISALLGRGLIVSRHRYGCRIVCRLIEHCNEDMICELLNEILAESDLLARHQFGNFVIQTALEHASPARRSSMVLQLLPGFATLAKHRSGSLVAQRIFDYCTEDEQSLAIHAMLQGQECVELVEIACHRYGSYVLEQVAGLRCNGVQEVAQTLASKVCDLQASEHAVKVVQAFGLAD